jgi:hypothetical protein
MLFYTRQSLCQVLHLAKNTRQTFINKEFFAEYFFWTLGKGLPSVEKHSTKKNTR